MRIVAEYSFNGGDQIKTKKQRLYGEVVEAIRAVDAHSLEKKTSKEKTMNGVELYSPIEMNKAIKDELGAKGWEPVKIPCQYDLISDEVCQLAQVADEILKCRAKFKTQRLMVEFIAEKLSGCEDLPFKIKSPQAVLKTLKEKGLVCCNRGNNRFSFGKDMQTEDLAPLLTLDFVGYREMDFVKDKVGVEVQFGKYSFMVYNVCAKMTIFKKMGHIEYGIEIVPTKELQKEMSTGVSFYEQFVWDLEQRGVSNIDIPVLVIGIAP